MPIEDKRGHAPAGFARMPEHMREERFADGLLAACAEEDASLRFCAYAGLEIAYESMREASFEGVEFRNCMFEGVDFSRCALHDVRFVDCRFVRGAFDGAWLQRCDFIGCSAPGASFLKARLASVSFVRSDVRYANLSEISADVVRAYATRFSEASVQSAKLKRVSLHDSELVRVDFFGTPLAGIDVSTCEFDAPVISGSMKELRGLTVSAQQALDLSSLLGIVVADG